MAIALHPEAKRDRHAGPYPVAAAPNDTDRLWVNEFQSSLESVMPPVAAHLPIRGEAIIKSIRPRNFRKTVNAWSALR